MERDPVTHDFCSPGEAVEAQIRAVTRGWEVSRSRKKKDLGM